MKIEDGNLEKILIFDAERCTGCSICELICSMAKHGEYNPKKSYIRLVRNREMDVNVATLDPDCDFCNECVEACIPEAIRFVSPEEGALIRKQNQVGIFPAPLFRQF